MKKLTTEMKVGLFAAIAILLAAVITVKVSERAVTAGRGYELSAVFDHATGLKIKAPVELAGVQVGVVQDIELFDSRRAKVTLLLNRKVKLPVDSRIVLRARGFLGETYVELIPGSPEQTMLKSGAEIEDTMTTGDMNSLVNQFNEIAADIKAVTSSLRTMVGNDDGAPINRIVGNLDKFSESIKIMAINNQDNVDKIATNLADFTAELKGLLSNGRANVEESIDRIASITRKIDTGKGSVGKLVNDEETVEKLNDALDNLNETLGGFKKLETEIGYHTEYMVNSSDFKHYVSLALRPAPDKAFMFDIVSDTDPPPTFVNRTTDVTVNGNTTTVQTTTGTIDRNALRFSAQLAKKFYDFQLRGGIIESTGGVGADYFKGPIGLTFEAFNFTTRYSQRPHLKAHADLNLTKNFYVMGGADDFINPNQSVDYFVGAGFRLVDDDIKSIFSMGSKAVLK
jgi:phospholipid/cholesterol/gamma-HCH transport system substrate-binding protein